MTLMDRQALIEHLKAEHEPLEVISYAAITMTDEQDRDASAVEFNRRFQGLKRMIGELSLRFFRKLQIPVPELSL
jgi:hypothetical protein